MTKKTRSYLFGLHWFTVSWWKYLLEKPSYRAKRYCKWWTRFWCRAMGHPEGVWYYNSPDSSGPDYTCKNCGDEI